MKTIVFNLFNGFNIRYLVESGIINDLKNKNLKIILVSYNFEGIKELFKDEKNIIFYKLDKETDKNYRKSFLDRNLNTIKYYTYGGNYNSPKIHLKLFINDYLEKKTTFKVFYIVLLKFIILSLNKFSYLRNIFSKLIETRYPYYYNNLYNKYDIDLVVCTSLGTFANDDFLLRSAKKNKIRTASLMLSWDNSTTRGYPGCKSDYVIAWTELMKNELVELSDISSKKVFIAGSAQFDHYFNDLNVTKENFIDKFKLNKEKKILFFATRGPNTYASNGDIIQKICEAINKEEIKKAQLIVRVHPLHYNSEKIDYYKSLFKQYEDLQIKYKDILHINYPSFKSKENNFFFNKENTIDLHSFIYFSDVIINVFSTVMIEGAIFNKPLINVCYQKNSVFYNDNLKSRYDIKIDFQQDHNQRLLKTGGIYNCLNDEELIKNINHSINFPNELSKMREQIVINEVGPNKGNASKNISKLIYEFANKQN